MGRFHQQTHLEKLAEGAIYLTLGVAAVGLVKAKDVCDAYENEMVLAGKVASVLYNETRGVVEQTYERAKDLLPW